MPIQPVDGRVDGVVVVAVFEGCDCGLFLVMVQALCLCVVFAHLCDGRLNSCQL
jgi:hypothetical protein